MGRRATWKRILRKQIAVCAALLVLFAVADTFLFGTGMQAQGVLISSDIGDVTEPQAGGSECPSNHCHHVEPMPYGSASKAMGLAPATFDLRRAALLHSTDPPSLDRPPKG